jgi:hypothetical protein
VDTLDSVTFYPSATLDPRHHDDGNDKRGRLPKFKIFVAVEKYSNGVQRRVSGGS